MNNVLIYRIGVAARRATEAPPPVGEVPVNISRQELFIVIGDPPINISRQEIYIAESTQ